MADGTLCPVLVIIGDNSKGPLNAEYQFCLGILFIELDFDLIVRCSYAAYKSFRDPAEAGNGAIGRRTNGYPHQIDLSMYERSSVEDKKEMLEVALRNVCARRWSPYVTVSGYGSPGPRGQGP